MASAGSGSGSVAVEEERKDWGIIEID
jgi:hypothetical protein